jgi:N-acetylglucosamine-6-phosphate deacetylase
MSATPATTADGAGRRWGSGFFTVDFIDATPEQWRDVARRLAGTGVTAFAPTIITAPVEDLAAGLRRARDAMTAQDPTAARILGVHVEGPFLSDRRRGAHNPALLRDPDPGSVAALLGAGQARCWWSPWPPNGPAPWPPSAPWPAPGWS